MKVLMFVAVGAVMIAAAAVAVWGLPGAKFGDVDPGSLVVALVALALGLVGIAQARRVKRPEITVLAERLAERVDRRERAARDHLLDHRDEPIDVAFDLVRAPAHDADGAAPRGQVSQVAGYFAALRPRRMVITGEPGSGKTLTAVELILELVGSREADDPVPVRLPAPPWATATSPSVTEWLVGSLVDSYRLSRTDALRLVQADMVLPVVDGLDEMDVDERPGYSSRASNVVQALNQFLGRRGKAPLVLTCRTEQYRSLVDAKVWLHGAARVNLRPVSGGQARRFVAARVVDAERWRPVLEVLGRRQDHPVARALATPWRLALAVAVYEQRSPDTGAFIREPAELLDPALDTDAGIRDHLLGQFIPTQRTGYPPDRVHRWLAVLATYLARNGSTGHRVGGRTLSGTDLVPHELWPVGGDVRPRVVTAALTGLLSAGLPLGLVLALPGDLGSPLGVLLAARAILTAVALTGLFGVIVVWPPPVRIDYRRLRTGRGVGEMTVPLAAGLVYGAAVAARFGLARGLGLGLGIGLVGALGVALLDPGEAEPTDPRAIVRNDLLAGVSVTGAIFLAGTLTGGVRFGAVTGLLAVFLPALAVLVGRRLVLPLVHQRRSRPRWLVDLEVPVPGLVALRYLALLLSTRRWTAQWLPWRLSRFLDRCYRAGLLRIAGTGYQFRHRELQDYLAGHPLANRSDLPLS